MGKIYRYRVLDKITDEDLLRLSSVVAKSFVTDLNHLKAYKDVNPSDDYITDNLNALGLLKDCGNIYNGDVDENGIESISSGPTKHCLNEVGLKLLDIIEER